MKRLLIRMSVLGAVVVLGLIAIARAQRGAEDPAVPNKLAAPPRSLPQADTPRNEPGGSEWGLPAGSLSAAPRELPADAAPNPLRLPAGSDASVVAASDMGEPGQVSAAVEPSPDGQLMAMAPQNPFAARQTVAKPPAAPAPAAPPAVAPAAPVAPASPPAGAVQAPRAAQSPSGVEPYPALPPQSAPSPAVPPPSMPGAPADPAAAAPGYREPARLEAITPGAAAPTPLGSPDAMTSFPGGGLSSAPMPGGEAAPPGDGTGRPGAKTLEGPQSPQVTVQKSAPQEIQVGKPASFKITVRNTGAVPAHSVEVRDEVPKGTQLIETTPRASRGVGGELVWTLGTMKPGDEITVEMQLMPVDEGEIGSVASVRFNADATARSIATRPQLEVDNEMPRQVMIGEEVTLAITVSNPGSGAATGVVIEEHVPAGFQHPAGTELEYAVGDLKPKESRQVTLKMTAVRPGVITNVLTVRGDANLKAEHQAEIEVLAPQLDIAIDGPKRRFLEREGTYLLSVTNPGTAPARQVQLEAQLPPGLKFVRANNAGYYEESTRTVRWQLEELPVRETGTVELVTMPVEAGEQTLRYTSKAEPGLSVEKEQPVVIEGIAAILFQVADTSDPIEVNGETTYEVRVVNQGSKEATNVQVTALLPPGMRPMAADGPTRNTTTGNQVVFEGLARLAPKADTTYRIRVQGSQPGDQRMRIQLLTDEMETPVIKEESTRVFADE